MTEQEINSAIAEACGWVRRDESYWDSKRVRRTTCIVWSDPNGKPQPLGDAAIPNYCADLNAISEAVNFLNVPQREIFIGKFHEMTADDPEWLPAKLAKATPRQWSEAFLRTIGKWRDEA